MSTILHNIVISLAVVFGGIWAYTTYVYSNPQFLELKDSSKYSAANSLGLDLEYLQLDKANRLFELIIVLENLSKKNQILINYSSTELLYREAGNASATLMEASYERIAGNVEGFHLSSGQTQKLTYHVKFPKKGLYLVEYNACPTIHSDCLISRYINVE